MQKLLVKLFVKNPDDIRQGTVRQQYGKLSSFVGIVINLLLFAAKFTVGTLFNSISVTADAVNNLSDAGSSVISLASFKLSAKPADKDHPYGHARIEYVASSLVATVILFVGFELGKSSFEKILHPEAIEFSVVSAVVLAMSIGTKLWLYTFNHSLGRKINSTMMLATATDSLSDVLATSAVLISALLSPLIHFQLDGYMGLIVALLICFSGYKILRETVDRILGQGPTEDMVQLIQEFISHYDGVINTHDLMVHDYGPSRTYATVHVEVDAQEDILKSHDMVDNIERDIKNIHHIKLVVHLDPVIIGDPYVNQMRELTAQVIASVDPTLTFHDFRVIRGETHSNLVFDVMIPFDYKMKKAELAEAIQKALTEQDPHLFAVIKIDRILV